jgi:hypothetical protein
VDENASVEKTDSRQVRLPRGWTEAHEAILLRYLQAAHALSSQEWVQVFDALDLLHAGVVEEEGAVVRFQAFYQQQLDAPCAAAFLSALLVAADPAQDATRQASDLWQSRLSHWKSIGWRFETAAERFLLVYCNYWWQSFCKGYAREVIVCRELTAAGIAFQAHDLQDPVQRRSRYDLVVLGRGGDIKSSTAFLHQARNFPLRADFYLVRLYNEKARQWQELVLLTPETWHTLNGEPQPCHWQEISARLPGVLQVRVKQTELVVVDRAHWQQCVLEKQRLLKESENR